MGDIEAEAFLRMYIARLLFLQGCNNKGLRMGCAGGLLKNQQSTKWQDVTKPAKQIARNYYRVAKDGAVRNIDGF
jgi:hypothetical protein